MNFFLERIVFFDDFFIKATENTENNDDCVLIASQNQEVDNISGLCAFTKQENLIVIHYLIVSQQLRGKGFGNALLARALTTYNDITLCKLYTLARDNHLAQAFYEKLGFTTNKDELYDGLPCMQKTHLMYQLDVKK